MYIIVHSVIIVLIAPQNNTRHFTAAPSFIKSLQIRRSYHYLQKLHCFTWKGLKKLDVRLKASLHWAFSWMAGMVGAARMRQSRRQTLRSSEAASDALQWSPPVTSLIARLRKRAQFGGNYKFYFFNFEYIFFFLITCGWLYCGVVLCCWTRWITGMLV